MFRMLRLAALCLYLAALPAFAQTYPAKPVKIYVGFSAGGTVDSITRLLAERLSAAWSKPVVVENRPGANSNLATEAVARSAPDGYTLVIVSIGHAVNPALYGKLPFDPVKDFAPVVLIATAPNMLVVHPSVPAATVRELIAYARSNPGKLNVASSGGGTSVHLAAELFQSLTGTKFVHVPYKGAAPAMPDLLSGQVDLMFPNMPSALPHVKSGKLRALGVTSASRSAGAPDVPAIAETVPGFVVTTWYGLLAPAGTPAAVIAKFNAEVRAVLEQPEFRAKLVVQGADPAGGTPEEFAEFLRVETVKWGKVVREAGIRLE